MIKVRKSNERGKAQQGWLDSRHTFSFAHYYDPQFTGFRNLVVLNEDRVKGGTGFGLHGHNDMEIVSYILDGQLEHKDSLGTGSVLSPGDVQRMSAGRGVEHSEFNHSKTKPVHFLQIWILPEVEGIAPSYEEKHFSKDDKRNKLRLIVSHDGKNGSLKIHQRVKIYASLLDKGESVNLDLEQNRHVWIQVARGAVQVNGTFLEIGDGASLSEVQKLEMIAKEGSEILVFDLP
jgi:redox-sensitive bicupin YhaK (pirin superfamily)